MGTPDGAAGSSAGSDSGSEGGSNEAGVAGAPGSLYVAPGGSGTRCTPDAPCALETGRDQARALAPTFAGDVTVVVADGTYRLAQTFALTAADSGQNGHAIVYAAAAGAQPIWSGAVAVTGFAPSSTANVWVAALPTLPASLAAGSVPRQLYVNGRRATRARTLANPAGYSPTSTGFTLGDAEMASWPDRTSLEVVGETQWKMFRCPVSDVTSGGVTVAQPCWSYGQAQTGYTFDSVAWLENALELLDSGGEFYLDGAAGKVYYQPRAGEDLTTADVELPVLEKLVDAEGDPAAPMHDVTFRGIDFAYGTWLAPSTPDGYAPLQASMTPRGPTGAPSKPLANVTMHATHAVTFASCRFEHLGGAGLAFEVGAQGNLVDASVFADISAAAVLIGDVNSVDDHHPSDPDLIVSNNGVTGSYITRAGAEYYDAPGLFAGYTTATTFAHDELFDLPYTAISIGWGWSSVDVGGSLGYTTPSTAMANVVSENVISHHMRALLDGGAVYVLGAQAGSTLSGNVVANQGGPYGNLYLDNGSQGWTVDSNVVTVDAKADVASPDPTRSYWDYVQVGAPVATNNTIGKNFTNDPSGLNQQNVDPSNSVAPPTVFTDALPHAAQVVVAAAGTPLRSPEIAAGMPSTASSVYAAVYPAGLANDGNAYDGWSAAADDASAWWQVDLGAEFALDDVEVVSRFAIDQPETRRSYQVLASDDPTFATSTILGAVDATGIAHRAIFAAVVSPPVRARYVRVAKTVSEYFYLAEVRVHGVAAP